jgi:uncharacterized membrane protein (DUF485 family)
MGHETSDDEVGSIQLGIAFTVLIASGFFTFIMLGAFFPNILAAPVLPTHTISVGLAFGLALIAVAVLTTLVYALQANTARRKARLT